MKVSATHSRIDIDPGVTGMATTGSSETDPWPPTLGGAPVSPSAMARAVVVKAARKGRKTAVLVKVVRSMMLETGKGRPRVMG